MTNSISLNINVPANREAMIKAADDLREMAEQFDNNPTTVAAPPTTDSVTAATEIQGGVELDAAGFPWDSRIHSSSKKKTAKEGVWKKMRGVDPNQVQAVEAELRATMAIPAAQVETEAPKSVAAPIPHPAPAPAPAAPGLAPAPEPEVDEPDMYLVDGIAYAFDDLIAAGWTEDQIVNGLIKAEPEEPLQFPQLMQKITNAIQNNHLDDASVMDAVNSVGLASLALLSARPDLVQRVHDKLF